MQHVHTIWHMRKGVYIPDQDLPFVRRLERILKKRRLSLSAWFVQAVLAELDRIKREEQGK